MVTIAEPLNHIADLWGKPDYLTDGVYRLMRYVHRVNYEDKILLHNMVTGHLMLLALNERILIDSLPATYSECMQPLIDNHFIVPVQFDEHKKVVSMRTVLRKMDSLRHKPIKSYTILTTTACNARCYYCFEKGIETVTLSERTAHDIVDYIDTHREGNSVFITWFGGEPTVAADRIDQICTELRDRNIEFRSDIVTNGYLFDEGMVHRAKNLWNLRVAQISFDGTEERYNKTKAYVSAKGSPYQKVLNNISLLLDNRIHVRLRMNFDKNNYLEFKELIKESVARFQHNRFLQVIAYPIIGDFLSENDIKEHGDDTWFVSKIVELNDLARDSGLKRKTSTLPSLNFRGCEADSDYSIVINADGKIRKCLECFQNNQSFGTIYDGITNLELAESWKILADYKKCRICELFPKCMKMENCPGGERCLFVAERLKEVDTAVIGFYNMWAVKQANERR